MSHKKGERSFNILLTFGVFISVIVGQHTCKKVATICDKLQTIKSHLLQWLEHFSYAQAIVDNYGQLWIKKLSTENSG